MVWEILGKETLLKTPRFDVTKEQVRLPNGRVKDFYVNVMADCSVIMPITSDGKIVMLEEYRHACREVLLSLPGGNIEAGDTPDKTAEKELAEETGYTADRFEYVQAVFADPPRTGRQWHFYIAHNAQLKGKQELTEFEDLKIRLMTPQELVSALAKGEVKNLTDMGLMFLGLQKLGFIK